MTSVTSLLISLFRKALSASTPRTGFLADHCRPNSSEYHDAGYVRLDRLVAAVELAAPPSQRTGLCRSARNGSFRCRDGALFCDISGTRDARRDSTDHQKPRNLRDKLTDESPSSFPTNWVVADAVGCERVSAREFPANRENNREFCEISAGMAQQTSYSHKDSKVCRSIPYFAEQGI